MDWILYIDADEILVPESAIDMKRTLGLIDKTVGAVICIIEGIQTNADGTYDTHRGGYPRIFRNYGYPAIKFTGAVHEQITPSLRELGKQTISSNILIEHSGYDVDPETLLKKVKRNYNLLITQVRQDPRNAYIWHQLGQTLGQMKLNKEAEHAFLFANGLDTLSDSLKATNSAMLSHYAGNRGDYQKANFWAEKAVELAGDFLYARYLKAYTLLYLERYEEAEKEFLEALKLSERNNVLSSSGYDIAISRNNILVGYDKAKKKQTA
jgi:tetratricopeptide (TPR) repeat protein